MIERLYKADDLNPTKTQLLRQYRMHSSLSIFPSNQFYDSALQNDENIQAIDMHPSIWPRQEEHLVFVNCTHPHELGSIIEVGGGRSRGTTLVENNTSLQNLGEASLVVLTCQRLLKYAKCDPKDIAVITPYRAQKQLVEDNIKRYCGEAAFRDISVGTVYSLQGSERSFIILSFVRSVAEGAALFQNAHLNSSSDLVVGRDNQNAAVRQICESNLGIVSKRELINVSLTRAKHGLIVIGNQTVLADGSQDFLKLADHAEEKQTLLSEAAYRALDGTMAKPPRPQVGSCTDVAPGAESSGPLTRESGACQPRASASAACSAKESSADGSSPWVTLPSAKASKTLARVSSGSGAGGGPHHGGMATGTICGIQSTFGFIKQDVGGSNMFVLRTSCQYFGGNIPPVGTRVRYSVVTDQRMNLPRAENVLPEQERQLGQTSTGGGGAAQPRPSAPKPKQPAPPPSWMLSSASAADHFPALR